jgi:hypothetical protein
MKTVRDQGHLPVGGKTFTVRLSDHAPCPIYDRNARSSKIAVRSSLPHPRVRPRAGSGLSRRSTLPDFDNLIEQDELASFDGFRSQCGNRPLHQQYSFSAAALISIAFPSLALNSLLARTSELFCVTKSPSSSLKHGIPGEFPDILSV